MEEANNVKMASFLIFTFASSSPCLLHIFLRGEAQQQETVTNRVIRRLGFAFLPLPESLPVHCCRSGKVYERKLR